MPLETARIQAICFDVDGTLSDTDDQFVNQVAPFFRFSRNPATAARRFVMWAEAPGNALIGIPDTLGLDDEIDKLVEWLNRNRPRPLKSFLLIPGVKEMLERLAPHYPLAVVSARDDRSTRQFLDQFELTPFFKVIVTALSAPHTKPYPDPIYFAAEKIGVKPEHCLMVGDTTVDIRAGKNARSHTVGVLCGFGERAELEKKGADVILETTAQLVDVLGK